MTGREALSALNADYINAMQNGTAARPHHDHDGHKCAAGCWPHLSPPGTSAAVTSGHCPGLRRMSALRRKADIPEFTARRVSLSPLKRTEPTSAFRPIPWAAELWELWVRYAPHGS